MGTGRWHVSLQAGASWTLCDLRPKAGGCARAPFPGDRRTWLRKSQHTPQAVSLPRAALSHPAEGAPQRFLDSSPEPTSKPPEGPSPATDVTALRGLIYKRGNRHRQNLAQIKKPTFSHKPLQNSGATQGDLGVLRPRVLQVGHELPVPAACPPARPLCGPGPPDTGDAVMNTAPEHAAPRSRGVITDLLRAIIPGVSGPLKTAGRGQE